MKPSQPYKLYYWPGIQGRGEFVRLALEDAGAAYVDVTRRPSEEGGGVDALLALLREGHGGVVPFAPPALVDGNLLLFQTANILHHLGPALGLAPAEAAGQAMARQLQLTIMDLVTEAHDAHHPIAVSLYFEDQKSEASRRAGFFVAERMPKFLRHFEQVVQANRRGAHAFAVGQSPSYVDLSLYQVLVGLSYAFPRAMAQLAPTIPGLIDLRDRVAERPGVAAYLRSDRRLPFDEHGIFRHYPELDIGPEA